MSPVFHFYTRFNLPVLLGLKARTVPELLAGIRAVPGASIYYHTHRFLQQHHYLKKISRASSRPARRPRSG
jgi:hypothetical protein